MKIGLVGSNGAGKSEVCSYLQTLGFHVVSLSDIVRREATLAGLTLNREHLIETGSRLKNDYGTAYLAQESVKESAAFANVVFDSIRHPDEARFLRDNGVVLVAVDAPVLVRYERISARKKETDFLDFETFKAQDEWENLGKGTGQNIFAARQYCDITLVNNGPVAELYSQIAQLISSKESV